MLLRNCTEPVWPCQSSASGLDWWTRTLCPDSAGSRTPRSLQTSGWTGWRRPRADGCWSCASSALPRHTEPAAPCCCWRPLSPPPDGQRRKDHKQEDVCEKDINLEEEAELCFSCISCSTVIRSCRWSSRVMGKEVLCFDSVGQLDRCQHWDGGLQ